MRKLQDEIVIITGSTKGIGRSIAKTLASEGAAVVVNGRSHEAVEATVCEIESKGGRVAGVTGSVTDDDTGQSLVDEAVRKFGRVTCLINNAGNVRDHMSYKMSVEDFKDVLDVHVNGAFQCTLPFIQKLREQGDGGVLLNMTSSAGLTGNIGQVNYSAAKAGLVGMTWTLAAELKKDRIQVNAIAPAALTDMTRPHIEKAEQKAKERGKELPSYWEVGMPEDVANFVADILEQPDLEKSGEIFSVNGDRRGVWHPPQHEPSPRNK
ncbi:SDR family NAD(P)-dependent oxidoreductase [Pontibacillus marinus]|uniref:3-oxoacyl-ACP reductase n=1 Tax=Pontibacillus marinus BH030004 = DSM 16465 TaxID=1385511 RepID=A0A0A5GE87_9BACI|nr:SDR family NAD(P)-dependent oxidoreductase [Pontibacillus marinus]KGX89450.1 3-oxoacyl-ACP reductase [Pontibacillus marinus BH030004 = DSM 16465]